VIRKKSTTDMILSLPKLMCNFFFGAKTLKFSQAFHRENLTFCCSGQCVLVETKIGLEYSHLYRWCSKER